MAETLGDRWRHLAPKGKTSISWERMNLVVLSAAVLVTAMVLLRDAVDFLRAPADRKSTRLNSSHIQKSRMPSSA